MTVDGPTLTLMVMMGIIGLFSGIVVVLDGIAYRRRRRNGRRS